MNGSTAEKQATELNTDFTHKQYRAELYVRIMSEPGSDKRREILNEIKIETDYGAAEQLHKEEKRTAQKMTGYISTNDFKNCYCDLFMRSCIEYICTEGQRSVSERKEEIYDILRDSLKDSVLVDLGCGDHISVMNSYIFAAVLKSRKYIGIELHPFMKKEAYDHCAEVAKNSDFQYQKFLRLIPEVVYPPRDFIFDDMVSALSKRTEQANFIFSGIDNNIIFGSDKNFEDYMEKLNYHIARLTPAGGVVVGQGSVSLWRLKEYGFKQVGDEYSFGPVLWQKVS